MICSLQIRLFMYLVFFVCFQTGKEPADQCRREAPMFSVAVAPLGSKRRLWLHRDLCRFHGDETGQAVLSHLGPVCVGDFVEVPVVLSNGIGAADVSTVRWMPINLARRVPRVLSGSKALEAAANGLYEGCSLEMQYLEWFDGDQYRHMSTERLKRAGKSQRFSAEFSDNSRRHSPCEFAFICFF